MDKYSATTGLKITSASVPVEKEFYILENMKRLEERLSNLEEVSEKLGARVSTIIIPSASSTVSSPNPKNIQSDFANWLEVDVERLDKIVQYLQTIVDNLDL